VLSFRQAAEKGAMAMKCPNCHFENPTDTRFCGNCAAPLHLSEEIPAYADSETEYITDGLTESLIGTLSKLPGLRVISRFSVFQYILKKGGEI